MSNTYQKPVSTIINTGGTALVTASQTIDDPRFVVVDKDQEEAEPTLPMW